MQTGTMAFKMLQIGQKQLYIHLKRGRENGLGLVPDSERHLSIEMINVWVGSSGASTQTPSFPFSLTVLHYRILVFITQCRESCEPHSSGPEIWTQNTEHWNVNDSQSSGWKCRGLIMSWSAVGHVSEPKIPATGRNMSTKAICHWL